MAKKVIVGGRIESKEVGGIVTGAAEILDDTKGKKQNVINQETDAELERLDQSKQNNLTFDNAPTEGSDNPVKSGGLYTAQQAILLAIAAINELIPSAASVLNQLADKAFVNSSVSTNTATFRGTSAAGLNEQQFLAWANGLEHDLNDYVFWQTSDAAGNTLFKRYKWNGTEWAYEYTLNNSTFTAEQWEAIQSGITALLVAKLRALPTAQELIQSFDSKQDVLTFDDTPTLGSNNPVKSSGIYNVIKAITDLVPAEATAQNQLADKADVAAKIVAAIPSWKGQYDALTDLQAVTGAKAGDMGCVKTTDSDGHAVLTFYQYSAQGAWVVYYTLRHYAQNKPATTGTTGDYPYNGMGRIELQKNIVNGVNTLTQAMLTQQNTIYVIQYDFTLGEDITVPANCILEFDGGSISGSSTITGNNTAFCGDIKCYCNISGTFSNKVFDVSWLTGSQDITSALENIVGVGANIYIPEGNYSVTRLIYIPSNTTIYGDGYAKTIINNIITNTFQVNGDNIIIKDLAIVGAAQHDLEDPFVDQHGIYIVSNHNNIYISGCKFSKTVAGVFVDSSCKNINVTSCIFTQLYTHAPNNNGGYGIVCHGHNDDPNTSPTKCISITNNLFDFVSRHDLYIQSCEDVNIIGNKSYRPTDGNRTFDVYHFRGCKNVTITNNFCHGGATFINCVATALHPHPDNYIITNNEVRNTYGLNGYGNNAAITIADAGNCIVSNNIFVDNPGAFRITNSVVGEVVVSDNICLYKTDDNVINQCFIFNSDITGSECTFVLKDNQVDILNEGTGEPLEGTVYLGGCTFKQLIIVGNTFRERNFYCIDLKNTTVTKLVRIQNNTCIHAILGENIANTVKMVYITDNVANNVYTHSAGTYYIVRDNVDKDMG